MIGFRRLIALVAGTLALSACSLVGRQEDLTVYAPTIAHPTLMPSSPSPRAWQLIVAEPQAIGPLNGTRIVVFPQPGVVQFYKGARWHDSSPILIQELLLQAFQDSTNLAGTGTATTGLHADFVLQSDLQEFQAEYRGAQVPTVVVRLAVQLVDNSSNRSLATQTFTVEQPCASTSLPSVFAAFQVALGQMLPQIVDWTIKIGDLNSRARSLGTPNG